MNDKTLAWLLQEDNPSLRHAVLTDLLPKTCTDDEVVQTKKLIMLTGIVPKFLGLQNADGSWGTEDTFYTNKYQGTVWTLLILAELYADPQDERVQKACSFILQHCFCPETGGFSTGERRQSKTGNTTLVIPCLTGNMVFTLIRLGWFEDERVQRAIDWICTYQRTDDGDTPPPQGEMYDRYRYCWGSHSCHMGVAKSFKALIEIPEGKRNASVCAKIDEIGEYFLKHHLYKKSHHLEQVSKPGWTKFGFPLMYQTDALELLSLFARLKIHDPRLSDAIELVEKKKNAQGVWKLENSYNDKLLFPIEEKGKDSKWITLRALICLQEYQTNT